MFFPFIIISAFTVMVGISNNAIGLSSSSLFSHKEDLHNTKISVNIIDPSRESTLVSNVILVNGTTSDSSSAVQKVEVFAHRYPFNDVFKFKTANPVSEGNWSEWSASIPINTTGVYRILAHVMDNQGNNNWTEVKIFVPFLSNSTGRAADVQGSPLQVPKIAIVNPTFTEAAYSRHAFYTFYGKYSFIPIQKDVKTDLDMLNPYIQYRYNEYINPHRSVDIANLSLHTPTDHGNDYILSLASHLRKIMPHALITIIRDEDINNGYIFTSNDAGKKNNNSKNNAYDLLILAHDEYATQTMYNNYKRFVSNGGSILALDGNIFYAEIKYNKNNNTITFVKGHSWQFDGKSAKRDIKERWFNQNREWVGSNFLESTISDNITFKNNPFNYTHFEENFVNNPNDKILVNYDAVIAKNNPFVGSIVATYELDFGKGKVIMIGLYGQRLVYNEAFLRFLDGLILKYS